VACFHRKTTSLQGSPMKNLSANIALLCSILLLAGCNTVEPDSGAAIANPASEHCLKKGGKLEIVEGTAGQKGMCHLPDGTIVEEWELYRRDNPQG
jgi:putative hemolysin